MEIEIKVSSYYQKKVISSILNLFFFNDIKNPSFKIVDGKEVFIICDNFKKIIKGEDINEKIDYFFSRFQSSTPDKLKNKTLSMMIYRPSYMIDLALFLNFRTDIEKLNEENLKILKSLFRGNSIHPLVKEFIGDIIMIEEEYNIYNEDYITRESYDVILKSQFNKYKSTL